MRVAWQMQTLLVRSNLPEEPLVRTENIKYIASKEESEVVRAYSELVLANHYELGVCVI